MNKSIFIVLGILAILIGGFFALNSYIYHQKQADTASEYKNAEYVIEGQRVKLHNGFAESEAAPGSASKITTRYFGNDLEADLNNDGRDDMVFILTQQTGGSGTFYYVVAALNTIDGYRGSEGYFLGDRIAPQSTQLSQDPGQQGVIVINYADRASGEPMSAQPSVGKSIWLKLDPSSLRFDTVEQGSEDGTNMPLSLTMKSWTWVSALYNDGRSVEPNRPGDFILTFTDTGTFSATTDCNHVGGNYAADAPSLSFSSIIMTKMFCEGSQENEFLRLLEGTALYHFTSEGELIFDLAFDSGTATFE